MCSYNPRFRSYWRRLVRSNIWVGSWQPYICRPKQLLSWHKHKALARMMREALLFELCLEGAYSSFCAANRRIGRNVARKWWSLNFWQNFLQKYFFQQFKFSEQEVRASLTWISSPGCHGDGDMYTAQTHDPQMNMLSILRWHPLSVQ